MKCELCVHYDANKNGFLPLCKRFPQTANGEGWFFTCLASRALDELCGTEGEYFEPKQPELRQAQEDCVIEHFLN